jgi:DNA polymerase/3'-5' exonuclease PolX
MITMLTDLKNKGYIPYIEKVINNDKNYLLRPINDKLKFNKDLIIKNLEIIRNYEIYNNNIDKGKAYINAIINIKKYHKEITEMKDLKEIKGIGKAISLLINELKNNGKISYIDNIINKDKKFLSTIENNAKLFNKELLIQNLEIIKDYEIYNNEIYKVKAYNTAINNILIYQDKITSINDIDNIEGLGAGILEKIYEYYLTGKISYIENNIKTDKIYNFKQELLNIYGIGPVNAKKIIELGIQNIEQLKKNNNILNDKQKIGLKYFDELKLRIPLTEYKEHLKILKKDLSKLTFDFVGSYRRGSNNMGDIDLLIMENDKFNLKKYVSKLIDNNYIVDVLASGKNKFMGIVKLKGQPARRLDILIAPVNEYYYSLLYFTGSNLFNIGLRHYVKTVFNLSLSEHGFNKQVSNINSEEDIFKYLKLKYVKPIDRNKFEI